MPTFLRALYSANDRKAHIARTLIFDSMRSFWALADQGVVSLGNFGVNILLYIAFERIGEIAHYGDFWTLMELMLFLNGLHGALIVYPLTVRGANSDAVELARRTTLSLILTLLAWPFWAAGITLVAWAWSIPAAVGIWASVALLFWHFQETTRRAIMSHLRFRGALLGDVLSYLGQVVAVAVLAHFGRLTLVTAFQAMAFTSALGMLLQWAQIGFSRHPLGEFRQYVLDCWMLGRWLLTGNLMNFVGPIWTWSLRYWAGDHLVGVAYALSNLLRLTNPLSFAISSMIMPMTARAARQEGLARARTLMLRFGLVGAMLMTPYLGVILVFPKLSIAAVYGWDSECIGWPLVLQLLALAAAASYAAIVTGSFLNAVEHSRLAFIGQTVFAAAMLVIAIPLVATAGLVGSGLGLLLATAAQLVAHLWFIHRLVPVERAPLRSHAPALLEPSVQK